MAVRCVCMHAYPCKARGSGGMVPQEIFGYQMLWDYLSLWQRKQSRSSSLIRYMTGGVLYPIFGCPCMHLLSQLTSNFHVRRYYGWQNSRWGDRWWNSMRVNAVVLLVSHRQRSSGNSWVIPTSWKRMVVDRHFAVPWRILWDLSSQRREPQVYARVMCP